LFSPVETRVKKELARAVPNAVEEERDLRFNAVLVEM
jgi:hypothetical protein